MSDLHTCSWCDEGASDRVKVARRRGRDVYAYACREHARRLSPAEPEPVEETVVEERTEPLCTSCYDEVTWVQLVKDGRRTKRMPVDRRPLRGAEIKRSMVVVNPRKGTAVVLTQAHVDSGEAKRWVDAGAQLHLSHFVTCSSAKQHRRQKAAAKAA